MDVSIENSEPIVSIIIPVFNGEAFIQEAIFSALQQTYSKKEVIVIEDGSTDGTFEILQELSRAHSIKVFRHPDSRNHGTARSRWLGVSHAKGKYIAFLDADDQFMPTKIKYQVAEMEKNPDVVLCHTAIKLSSPIVDAPRFDHWFNFSDRVLHYNPQKLTEYMIYNRVCNSTVMIRTDVLRTIDFCSPQTFQSEDWLLVLLLSEKGKFLYLPNQLVTYSYHTGSYSYWVKSNPLRDDYARVETYLALFSRLQSPINKIRAFYGFSLCLRRLYLLHSKNSASRFRLWLDKTIVAVRAKSLRKFTSRTDSTKSD